MKRREFLKTVGAGLAGLALLGPRVGLRAAQEPARKPNIVFILADDLGTYHLG